MSVIVTRTLTDTYLRRLDRGKYLALGGLVCLVLAGVLGFVFHVAQNIPDLVSNIMYPLTSGVGAFWAFVTGYRAYRDQFAWERITLEHGCWSERVF